MNTKKCPSRAPRFFGMILIVLVAPALFVLGFGANKTRQNKPQQTDLTRVAAQDSVTIETLKDETVFIYADAFTISRNDAALRVVDAKGDEIQLIAQTDKPIVMEGEMFGEFRLVASFTAPGGAVTVYGGIREDKYPGEFFVGSRVAPRGGVSLLMPLCFVLGLLVMALGAGMAVSNIAARKKWFDAHAA